MAGYSVEWVTVDDLSGTLGSAPSAEDAVRFASYVLWALTGRRYGRIRTVTETYECACRRDPVFYMPRTTISYPQLLGGLMVNTPAGDDCGCAGVTANGRHTRLRLRGRPVRSVIRVRKGSTIVPADQYSVDNNGLLRLSPGSPGDVCGLEVTYAYGTGIPPGGKTAARILAEELIKGWDGVGGECQLPSRVTSVSRQGIEFTILDNQSFLDQFKTGIYEIDLFLKSANPAGALKPAKVFSPDLPKAYRQTIPAPGADAVVGNPGTQVYDLVLVEGESLDRGFRRYSDGTATSLASYEWAAQIRTGSSSSSPLIIDLTPYLELSGTDNSLLELHVPASVVDSLAGSAWSDAHWDLFLWPTGNPGAASRWLAGQAAYDDSVTEVL